LPLVTTSAGTKFGKTEAGAVWLDAAQTSPYRFFQFWINTDDADTSRFLRYFTLLPQDEIAALEQSMTDRPDVREAQTQLALSVTATVHGAEAAQTAAALSKLLFGGGDPRTLSERQLDALREEIPFVDLSAGDALPENQSGSPVPPDAIADVIVLLVEGKLAASRGAARRLLEQGGIYVNGTRATTDRKHVTTGDRLPGGYVLVRKGARDFLLARVEK
jgi:tyrosyl-tRNA synthetase